MGKIHCVYKEKKKPRRHGDTEKRLPQITRMDKDKINRRDAKTQRKTTDDTITRIKKEKLTTDVHRWAQFFLTCML